MSEKVFKSSAAQRASSKRRYDKRKAEGLCQYCPNKTENGHIRCEVCREIVSDYSAGRRDIWKLKGLCAPCGRNKPETGKINCSVCLENARTNYENHRQKRLKKNVQN